MWTQIRMVCLILMALCLTACSPVAVHLRAAYYLNPNIQQRSLPVQIKVFELKNRRAFLNASFQELWRHPRSVLGGSFVASQTLMLSPGAQKKIQFAHHSEAKYVAVMAIFRNPNGTVWRAVSAIPWLGAVKVFVRGEKVFVQ